jgi:hypothetical protein
VCRLDIFPNPDDRPKTRRSQEAEEGGFFPSPASRSLQDPCAPKIGVSLFVRPVWFGFGSGCRIGKARAENLGGGRSSDDEGEGEDVLRASFRPWDFRLASRERGLGRG